MRQHLDVSFEIPGGVHDKAHREERLDLVVPFTTPDLTLAALDAANSFGAGLCDAIRLLKIQLIPYPLDLREPPVPLEFLEAQLRSFPSGLPMNCEIRLAREFEHGLRSALNADSVIVLATRRRLWRTHTERLAASLRQAGHRVVMVCENKVRENERKNNA